jgi:hypothetical protein
MGNYDGELYTTRALRMRNVDVRTRELLAQGFLYDGHVFSLSLEAQANWNRMIAKHAADKLTFPTDEVSTFYGVRHSFVDAASFDAFADAYLAAVDTVIESGRALKDQINAATTVERSYRRSIVLVLTATLLLSHDVTQPTLSRRDHGEDKASDGRGILEAARSAGRG